MNKNKLFAVALTVCAALPLAACGSGKESSTESKAVSESGAENKEDYEVTDMLGRKVKIPGNASKYACIGAGALRMYTYVADDKNLVGVEDVELSWGEKGRPYNMSIPNLKELPVIGPGGPGNGPNAEALFAAKPDVIFTGYNTDISSVNELQEKTGIPVVAISYGKGKTGAGKIFDRNIYDSISLVGKITGNEDRANDVVSYIQAAKTDLEKRTENVNPVRAYLGAQSFKGAHGIESTTGDYEIFDVLKAKNVVNEKGINDYIMLDKETVLELDPEVIILDAGGMSLVKEDYNNNPDFYKSLSAVRNGKTYIQMPFNNYITNIDIALADAYYTGKVLYPDAFSDIDPAEKFDEITQYLLGINAYEKIASQYHGGYQQANFDK